MTSERTDSVTGDLAGEQGALSLVRAALFPEPTEAEPGRFICYDAADNLEGALIDLERTGADKICIETVRRVLGQLCAARSAIEAHGNRQRTEERSTGTEAVVPE